MDNLKQYDVNQFQEELAKTYFSTTPVKQNNFTGTKLPPQTPKTKKFFFLSILGLAAIFIGILFWFNRLEVNVNVFPVSKSGIVENANYLDRLYLSKDGEPNRELIKNVMFYENADAKSSWKQGVIILANEISAKEAVLGIDFNNPVDMSEKLFYFYAKGKRGGEDLKVSLRDTKNNLCYSKINELQNSWQQFVVDLGQAGGIIDTRSITHIDFAINSSEKQNLGQSLAYFKDLYFTKRRE